MGCTQLCMHVLPTPLVPALQHLAASHGNDSHPKGEGGVLLVWQRTAAAAVATTSLVLLVLRLLLMAAGVQLDARCLCALALTALFRRSGLRSCRCLHLCLLLLLLRPPLGGVAIMRHGAAHCHQEDCKKEGEDKQGWMFEILKRKRCCGSALAQAVAFSQTRM